MPIRQRGGTWQVDVRLPDGRRHRKSVKTEQEALELERLLQTSPQQRREMKKALRQSPAASGLKDSLHSTEPSVAAAVTSNPAASQPTISPSSPETSPKVTRWPTGM